MPQSAPGSIKILLIALGVICISGCAILPFPINHVVTTAHTIIDVNLQEETGKTSTEHLASEVTEKDCKWARIIDKVPVCMSREEQIDYILSKNCETITWNWVGIPRCKE